jgi:2-polyprenyl-3-methyl-5-hydroxy-6-metoxy-1,4-benzoquinol methylase
MSLRDYHDRPRREMEPFVPATARTVLDIGCGGGAFGAALKAARSGLEVWGVEGDADAAAHATGRLDGVVIGLAPAVLAELAGRRFDCVVMNDVIEHVAHPEELLVAARHQVAPGGCLVASIPNVRHHVTVADLALRGRWDYTDEGILDRTHLRFFTRSSMADLLRGCGYRVRGITGINRTGSRVFRLWDLLTLRRFTDMGYLQFACVAEPEGNGES